MIRRETFLSSLDLTREVLRGLGLSERDVRFAVDTFKAQDRRRLYEDYKHYTDMEKLQERAKSHTQELEDMFAKDAAEQAKARQGAGDYPLSPLCGERVRVRGRRLLRCCVAAPHLMPEAWLRHDPLP